MQKKHFCPFTWCWSQLLGAGFFLAVTLVLAAFVFPAIASKNLLPRLPELVIEKGYSDAFEVVECVAKSRLVADGAESHLKVVLKNVSGKPVVSALKIRILYLLSDQAAEMSVNGKGSRFDRKNPRVAFSLQPNEELTVTLEARQNILYNLDALKQEQEGTRRDSKNGKDPLFTLDSLKKLFSQENFGRRYLVGPLVSKWGIFPVPFRQVKLDITVPHDFGGVFPDESLWKKTERGGSTVFSFEGTDGFSGAVFLPKQDVDLFRKIQEESKPAPKSPLEKP